MEPRVELLAQFSRQKCRQTGEECSPPGSGQSHPVEGMRGTRPECRHASSRRQPPRLPGLREQARRPWVRLRDREFATIRSPVDSSNFRPNRAFAVGPGAAWDFSTAVRYFFFTLPGGGSLMTAQKTPSSLMAFTNSWKSTGFTTYALTPSS